jgi:hypothetical protein
MKILVAGAGIAGSCAATVLRDAGHEVVLADPSPSTAASRCALAVTRTAWWGTEQRRTVRRSLDWYNRRGHIITTTATVHDVRRGKTSVQGDHYLINPRAPLVTPDTRKALDWWVPCPGYVLAGMHGGTEHRFGALVLAAGPATAHFAGWPSDGRSFGGIFTAPGNRLTDGGRLAMLRRTDRLSYTAAWLADETRIGASRCSSPGQARRVADGIRDRLMSEGIVTGPAGDWEYRAGTRYATASPGAVRIRDRVWTLTGLARSGYALAPAAALDIATEIGTLT